MMKFNHRKSRLTLVVLSVVLLSLSIFNLTSARTYSTNFLTQTVGQEFSSEVQCLAENIYYEAGTESFEGKAAVAQVTINRANSGRFKSSICGVVKQKTIINGLTICQFSWFCEPVKKAFRDEYRWQESLIVARRALTEPHVHNMIYKENALYYHNTSVRPDWNLVRVGQIGNHIFYKEKPHGRI
jgi:spore germination cell wall hydrolase CwlJ-like protein